MLKMIFSGGQTGADRGALEAADELGFPYDGWVPRGRRANDGTVPEKYKLREHANPDYPPRTWANVRDSEGTLIVCPLPIASGSKLTLKYCRDQRKPVVVRDFVKVRTQPDEVAEEVLAWCRKQRVTVLNVAGSREKRCRGIQEAVRTLIKTLIEKDAKADAEAREEAEAL